jgi:hypothetical protein
LPCYSVCKLWKKQLNVSICEEISSDIFGLAVVLPSSGFHFAQPTTLDCSSGGFWPHLLLCIRKIVPEIARQQKYITELQTSVTSLFRVLLKCPTPPISDMCQIFLPFLQTLFEELVTIIKNEKCLILTIQVSISEKPSIFLQLKGLSSNLCDYFELWNDIFECAKNEEFEALTKILSKKKPPFPLELTAGRQSSIMNCVTCLDSCLRSKSNSLEFATAFYGTTQVSQNPEEPKMLKFFLVI